MWHPDEWENTRRQYFHWLELEDDVRDYEAGADAMLQELRPTLQRCKSLIVEYAHREDTLEAQALIRQLEEILEER